MGEQAQRTRGKGLKELSLPRLDGLFTPEHEPRVGFYGRKTARAVLAVVLASLAHVPRLRGVRRDQQEWEGHAVGAARLDAGDG